MKLKNTIEKRIKTKGFPRSTGHCAAFDVSNFVETGIRSDDDIIKYLYDMKYDLTRGDLICYEGLNEYRNDGIHIFDGCKIIDLDYDIDDYGALPNEFTVINNNVPIDYWVNNDEHKGIDHNNLVWFDHNPVKIQCFDNITKINGDLFTTFNYNDKIYKIYGYRSDFDDESKMTTDEFLDLLDGNNKLLLDQYDYLEDDENTLYVVKY